LNIFLLLILINSLLSRFAVIKAPLSSASGVSSLYFAVAFMIIFAIWYGMWGALSAYIGCMIGAGVLADMPFSLNVIWSLADLWQVMIPIAAFSYFKLDILLRTKRDLGMFFIFACILNNLVGALWGSMSLVVSETIPWTEFTATFEGWFIGNVIATTLIVPFILRYITPYIAQTETYVNKYWI